MRVYIYLDSEGIESLYAQTTDRVELELTRSVSKEARGEVGLKLGFGNLLSSLLGLKEAAAQTKLEAVRGQIEAAKSRLSIEHKLIHLSEYLTKMKECFENLEAAAERATKPGQPVFVRIETNFDVPDFLPGGGGVSAVNSSKAMVFRIDNRYDASDSYFKRPLSTFVRTASLEKFPRLKGGMGATAHEAIFFRGFSGKDVPLGVFGYFIRLNMKACQIKAYAIWLPGGYPGCSTP